LVGGGRVEEHEVTNEMVGITRRGRRRECRGWGGWRSVGGIVPIMAGVRIAVGAFRRQRRHFLGGCPTFFILLPATRLRVDQNRAGGCACRERLPFIICSDWLPEDLGRVNPRRNRVRDHAIEVPHLGQQRTQNAKAARRCLAGTEVIGVGEPVADGRDDNPPYGRRNAA
jgi:hypothetical protein